MRGPSRDHRDYYNGKESQRFLERALTRRPRTRGERIAGVIAGLLYVPLWLGVTGHEMALWLPAAVLLAVCLGTEVVLGHRDKRRRRTNAPPIERWSRSSP